MIGLIARVGDTNMVLAIVLYAAAVATPPVHVDAAGVVERIRIHGNVRTRDKTIRHAAGVSEAQPFDVADIENVCQRLGALGFFTGCEVSTRPGSAPGLVTIEIDVTERPTTHDTGFSSVESFIAEVRMSQN